jgi:sugar/nucleoside kinase (ribokinase family)
MKYDVITIGSAAQDTYLFSKKFKVIKDKRAITGESECFAFGTKIELDHILYEVGGGATNTANTFKRQGLKVACLGRIGNDGAGEEVKKFLKASGIGDLLVVDKKDRTAQSVIFLAPNGERTILVYRGAAHHFKTADVDLQKIKSTRWLYISSLAGNTQLLEKIVLFAKKNKIKVALNPGKLEIARQNSLRRIIRYVDLLLINREEAITLLRSTKNDDRTLSRSLSKLCPGLVVMTKGTGGSVAVLEGVQYRVIIKPVRALDTTGAGDSFGSGLLSGLIKYRGDVKKALLLASQNSASDVLHIGAKHGALWKNAGLKNFHCQIRTQKL